MAQVTICDRCSEKVGTDPGMDLEITDTVRGVNGKRELCGDCAGSFVDWVGNEFTVYPSPRAAEREA